jgi:hypothetical protein
LKNNSTADFIAKDLKNISSANFIEKKLKKHSTAEFIAKTMFVTFYRIFQERKKISPEKCE